MAGQYFDAETGLHYNDHRYYDPSIGRYLRPDPIGLAGGANLFAYALNNPINLIDPLGLMEWNSISSYHALHRGYRPPTVDIPWKEYISGLWSWTTSEPNEKFCESNPSDLNGDGTVDAWDELLWFSGRSLWHLVTPPLAQSPPGYGSGGPGTSDPIVDQILNKRVPEL